jgi:hypothetical protein
LSFGKDYAQLEAWGSEAVGKIYARQGAGENPYGVKPGDLRGLAKKLKTNHLLAGGQRTNLAAEDDGGVVAVSQAVEHGGGAAGRERCEGAEEIGEVRGGGGSHGRLFGKLLMVRIGRGNWKHRNGDNSCILQ